MKKKILATAFVAAVASQAVMAQEGTFTAGDPLGTINEAGGLIEELNKTL